MAANFPGAWQFGGFLAGWRGLTRFWVAVLLLLGIGAGVLQVMGPPSQPVESPAGLAAHPDTPSVVRSEPDVKPRAVPQLSSLPILPGRNTAGPTAEPDPSLQEPFPGDANFKLPRVGVDGRPPMAAYAAGFDPTSLRPRVGLLIAGIGMSQADSLAAIKSVPGGVSFAISPYAVDIGRLLDVARISGHEYLLSIPMEPQGYPVNDPDDRHALMTSLPSAENLIRLRWALSRHAGYVGITNALGPMRGERLTAVSDQIAPVLEEVGHRGLLFVDARPGQPVLTYAWNRSVDMVIDDDPIDASVLDQRLELLSRRALDKGSALGIVSVPRPLTVSRVAAWTNTLAAKGLALAPVSALVLPPANRESEK